MPVPGPTDPPQPASTADGEPSAPTRRRPYISLFWRLFIPNAAVVLASGIKLWVSPANGRAITLAITVAVMLAVNLVLMRRAFAPLAQLNASMRSIEPPASGERIRISGPESEVTRLAHSFNAMLDRLETERRDSARRAMQAQEKERRRIATGLHDGLGQDLTALVLKLKAVAAEYGGDVAVHLESASDHALATVEDMRRLARQLRPEALEELGLVPALAALCKRNSDPAGLGVRFLSPSRLHPLSTEQELTIYRVAQESLTNAVRHSLGSVALVRLEDDGGAVTLTVEDDGRGLNGSTLSGGGIDGMRERAMLNGARLTVGKSDEGGVRVVLRVYRSEDR